MVCARLLALNQQLQLQYIESPVLDALSNPIALGCSTCIWHSGTLAFKGKILSGDVHVRCRAYLKSIWWQPHMVVLHLVFVTQESELGYQFINQKIASDAG